MRSLLAIGAVALAASLSIGLGVVASAEFVGVISRVDGEKITFTKKGEKGKETTLSAANAKILKGTFNKKTKTFEAGAALEGGLKNPAVKAGAYAFVVTDADDKVVEIRVGGDQRKKP